MSETVYNIIFIVIVVIYASFGAALIYHLLKFSFLGSFTKVMTVIFIIVSALLLVMAYQIIFGPTVYVLNT